jgi:hypothetical protein
VKVVPAQPNSTAFSSGEIDPRDVTVDASEKSAERVGAGRNDQDLQGSWQLGVDWLAGIASDVWSANPVIVL